MDGALLRIEHKLDLLLLALQAQGMLLPAPLPSLDGKAGDTCPVCGAFHRFSVDTKTETVGLSCGCRPPVSAVPGISSVGVPIPSTMSRKEFNDEQHGGTGGGEVSGQDGSGSARRP